MEDVLFKLGISKDVTLPQKQSMGKKIQNWLIPSNIRFLYDKIAGNDRVHTENDLRQSDIKALRDAYISANPRNELLDALAIQGVNYINRPRDIIYDDYNRVYYQPTWDFGRYDVYTTPKLPQDEKSLKKILQASLHSPGYRMSTAIGKADYFTDDNGNVIVTDKYKYDPKLFNPSENAIYEWVRNKVAPKYGKEYDVRINLGNPNNW